jgi:hypothetical protein
MIHAQVIKDGFRVPLIGIPASSVEEKCDRCGEIEALREVRYTGKRFLCEKCEPLAVHEAERNKEL